MIRSNWIGAPEFYHLNMLCRILGEAFNSPTYLVGSSLDRRDFRDVDLRCILPDEKFYQLFPDIKAGKTTCALWCLVCAAISEWLSSRSHLKIDFQLQSQTEADHENGPRIPLGIFL